MKGIYYPAFPQEWKLNIDDAEYERKFDADLH